MAAFDVSFAFAWPSSFSWCCANSFVGKVVQTPPPSDGPLALFSGAAAWFYGFLICLVPVVFASFDASSFGCGDDLPLFGEGAPAMRVQQ